MQTFDFSWSTICLPIEPNCLLEFKTRNLNPNWPFNNNSVLNSKGFNFRTVNIWAGNMRRFKVPWRILTRNTLGCARAKLEVKSFTKKIYLLCETWSFWRVSCENINCLSFAYFVPSHVASCLYSAAYSCSTSRSALIWCARCIFVACGTRFWGKTQWRNGDEKTSVTWEQHARWCHSSKRLSMGSSAVYPK